MMINRENIMLLLLFFIFPFSSYGQPGEGLEIESLEEMTEKVESMTSKLKELSVPLNITKTPIKGVYLDEEWSTAVVYTKSREFLNTVARYNIQKSRMEIKVENDLRTLQIKRIHGIIISDELFVPLASGEKDEGNNLQFYKVLAEGELTLLAKYKLTLHTVGSSPMHKNIGTKKEYKSSEHLYYCLEGEKPKKLKKGKKNILQLFEAKRTQMEKIVDENDLGFRKESHLIALFDHYNEGSS